MRVLIASDLHWPTINGIATFGDNLASGLVTAGHDVAVVAPSQTGRPYEEMHGNYQIFRTSSLIFPFYQNLRVSVSPQSEIKKIVKQYNPDVIHVQTPLGVGMGAIAAARKFNVPLVATNHSMSENLIDNLKLLAPFAKPIDRILREFGSRFYSYADYVTLPTMSAISMLKPDSFAKPYAAISNGVDLERFQPGPSDPGLRERFGLAAKLPVVMYLGRLDAEKHISILVKAAAAAMQKQPFQVVIVGSGNDLDRLEDLAGELGISQHVVFTGRLDEDDKPAILREADIFVMPSPAELQSIATLEAMASGAPIIVGNAGAVYELGEEGKNGYLFAVDDVTDLAGKLTQMLASGKKLQDMSRHSVEIAHRHDLGRTISAYTDLYVKVAHEYRPSPSKLTSFTR